MDHHQQQQHLGSMSSGDWEWIRPSMLKMIRSAKSRLQRDSKSGASSENEGEGIPDSKKPSRPGAEMTGSNTRRSSKGSVATRGDEENVAQVSAALQKMSINSQPLGGGPVLGDLTNTGRVPGPQAPNSKPPKPPPPPMVPLAPPAAPPAPPSTAATPDLPTTLFADEADSQNPQNCAEYVQEIYKNLQSDETRCLPAYGYMEKHAHVNAKMRGILVDWLVDVHRKYKLRSETLYLAVSIIDRYLEVNAAVPRRILQLVGVTAMLIAAKFEELHPPQVKEFVYVTDKTYTEEEVMRMEATILQTLNFMICRPTAYHFLERFQRLNGCTEAHKDLAQYVLELTLVDYRMVQFTPSVLAGAAVLLSNKLLRRKPSWPADLARQSGMEEEAVKTCAKELCSLLESAETNSLQAVRKKFSQQRFHQVAKQNFVQGAPSCIPTAAPPSTSSAGSTTCPSSCVNSMYGAPSSRPSSRPSTSGR